MNCRNLDDGILMEFPGTMEEVDEACRRARSLADLWNAGKLWFNIHLVLREVLNNAVLHGCANNPQGLVRFEFRKDPQGLLIRVADPGPGFSWRENWDNSALGTQDHGRGIPILRAYAKDVCYNESGNEISILMNVEEEARMTVTKKGTWTVVAPQKDVVSSMAAELRKELKALVDQGSIDIEIDLKSVDMMDSMGLGLLIALHNSLKEKGGKLRVVNLSPELMELFKNMRLDRHFEMTAG